MEGRADALVETSGGAVDRALDIIEFLAAAGGPRGLTEIAAQVGGPKASVHRILATLCARGYVTHDLRSSYRMGMRAFEIGSTWVASLDIRAVSAPHLRTLQQVTRETVVLSIYDQGHVIYIDKIESPQPVLATSALGRRSPALLVATGRALLAFQPTAEITAILEMPVRRTPTDERLMDPQEVEEILENVRHDGYSVTHGTYREGVSGIGAPVRDYTGAVVAAVGLTLPSSRGSEARIDALTRQVVECASGISTALGWHAR